MKPSSCGDRLRIGLWLFFALSALAAAQPVPGSGASADRPDWGTKDRILSHIDFAQFIPRESDNHYSTYTLDNSYGLYAPGGIGLFVAVAHIPSGALLSYLELDYCDAGDDGNVNLTLEDCNYHGAGCSELSTLSSFDGATGCSLVATSVANYTMDNNLRELVLTATTTGAETTVVNGVYLGYKLQLSVAPMSPTFGDVPTTHTYYRAIEALASSGITGGCGNGNFCPAQNVTRGEMAAFLARALGLHFSN